MGPRVQEKKILKEVIFFLVKFNLILIPYYLVIYLDLDFYILQKIFASFVGTFLRAIGYPVEVSSFLIFMGNFVIDISRDCIGWKSSYSLFALILASPGKLKEKLKFLSFWIPFFLIINFFRVVITIIIGVKFGLKYLEILHDIVWQEIMILGIVAVWYHWMKRINKLNKRNNNNNIGI